MSDSRSIAAVTATLAGILSRSNPGAAVSGAKVTLSPPGSEELEQPCVNLWLAAVLTPPSRGSILLKGPVERPARAGPSLNLVYRLSFYGDHRSFEPQRLMGHVALALAAQPVMEKGVIAATLHGIPSLKGCDLADELRIALLERDPGAALADPVPCLLYEVTTLVLG